MEFFNKLHKLIKGKKDNNTKILCNSINKQNMIITINRESICMGDDCLSHEKQITINKNMTIAELLFYLSEYVPSMVNVVWTVYSDKGLCGYIITDYNAKSTIEVYGDNIFVSSLNLKSVFCKYYHNSYFSWVDGKTGNHINKYSECETLLEKVKKQITSDKSSEIRGMW